MQINKWDQINNLKANYEHSLGKTQKVAQKTLPNKTAAILSCLSGYLGKNLYSSNKFAIIQSKILFSLTVKQKRT